MSDEATTKRKVVIHRSDVPDDISAAIVTNIKEALDKFQIEKVSSPICGVESRPGLCACYLHRTPAFKPVPLLPRTLLHTRSA